MLKQHFPIHQQRAGRGESVFIYPLDTSAIYFKGIGYNKMTGLATYWKSPYHEQNARQLNFHFQHTDLHNNTVRKKTKDREKTRGILKSNNQPSLPQDNRPESSRSTARCVDKKRKSFSSRRGSTCTTPRSDQQTTKKERKVQFDDRQSRLNDLVLKYRVKPAEKQEISDIEPKSDRSCPRKDDCDDKFDNFPKTKDNEEDKHFNISDVISSSNGSYSKLNSVTKTSQNEAKTLSIQSNNVEKISTEDNRIPSSIGISPPESLSVSLGSSDVFEVGSYQLTNKTRHCVPTSDENVHSRRTTRNKSHPDISKRVPCLYDDKIYTKKYSEDPRPRVTLGRRRISGKTTVNTLGGAVVTRSHVRPIMFSRCAKEPIQIATDCTTRTQRNFCDPNKTNQIVQWLQDVREVQSKEGFCINSGNEIKRED